MRKYQLLIAIIFLGFFGCGGEDPNDELLSPGEKKVSEKSENPITSEENKTDQLWGVDDDRDSEIVHVGSLTGSKIYLEERSDSLLITHHGQKIEALLSADGDHYLFQETSTGINVGCQIPISTLDENKVRMECTINESECEYVLERKNGGYIQYRDGCRSILNNELQQRINVGRSVETGNTQVSKAVNTPTDDSIWDRECGLHGDTNPKVCSNVVQRNGFQYFYKNSCDNTNAAISNSNGEGSDGKNILNVERVYTEDEKEGCFLFICNGPHGNFHMLIMPYNKGLLEGDSPMIIAEKIRNAEASAPISYHTLLPGPYQKDNQCEWYDNMAVGAQDVVYNSKPVWDWDNFCIEGQCPYKIMFVIWESDEEKKNIWTKLTVKDDYISYGVVRRKSTLNREKSFSTAKFKIELQTNDTKETDSNFYLNETKSIFFESIYPFSTSHGEGIQGPVVIHPDPFEKNTLWLSIYDRSTGYVDYRLVKWNHGGTVLDFSDDTFDDQSSNITGDAEELDASVESLSQDDEGGLWFGTRGYGLVYKDPENNWTHYLHEEGEHELPVQFIDALTIIDGKIYVASLNSVWVYDHVSWERVTVRGHLYFSDIYSIAADPWNGNILLGAYEGVYNLDGARNISRQVFFWEEDLNEGWIRAIFPESENKIWFGTFYDGVFLWDRSNNTTTHVFNSFEEGVEGFNVSQFMMDNKNRLWVATGHGLAYIDENLIPHHFGWFKPDSGLDSIVQDSEGRIFVGGNGGGMHLVMEKPQ